MPLELTTPTPKSVRVVRLLDAPLELVWQALTEPALVQRWMTGPPGHSLPVCEIDLRVGGEARYVWKNESFQMGMSTVFQEVVPHERIVHTEAFEDWEEGQSLVTTSFTFADDRTRLTIDIEYGSQEARDAVVESGFEEGYEASFLNLDALLVELTRS